MSANGEKARPIEASQHKVPDGIKLPIYMDNHATSPIDPRVLDEMLPYFKEKFGNAASRNHPFGWVAEEAVELSRERIAKLIGATSKEIIFTSGATESDNLAIKGVAEMYREKGTHIITAVTEHKAVLDTCKHLEKLGFRVTYLPVQKDGLIDLDDLRRAIDDKTILVTIMAANNEIGVLQPVAEIGKLCHERGVLFHCDAVQAVGKVPIDVNLGSQVLWAEGRGRAVCAPQESACSTGPDYRRRRSRAGHAFGHAECPGHCGTGQGVRDRAGRDGAGVVQACRSAQPATRQYHEPARRGLH
jgi:selenocysteine lyase/cysteine desulfurase